MAQTMTPEQLGISASADEADIQRQVMRQLQAQGMPMGGISQNDIGVHVQDSGATPQVYDYDQLSAAEKRAIESDPTVRHIQQEAPAGIQKVDQYGQPIVDDSQSYGQQQQSSYGAGRSEHHNKHHGHHQQRDQPMGGQSGGAQYSAGGDNGMYNGVNLPKTTSTSSYNKPQQQQYQSQPMKQQSQPSYQPQMQQRQEPEQNKCCTIM